MRKFTYGFLLSLLIIPACSFFHSESVQPLTGEKTAELVSKFYEQVGPRIGSYLVEPNAVITIAGLRGHGNFLMHRITNDEKNALEKLNESSKELGIKFFLIEDPQDETVEIIILNFKGLEYSSKKTKLPFVPPFDSKTGFDGYLQWKQEIYNKAVKYFKDKDNNYYSEEGLGHLMLGLELGYPDQALLDMYSTFINKEINLSHFKLTHIPYSDYYPNPQPNFVYLSEHETEKSIVAIQESWGNLLKQFYNSPWHTNHSKDQTFIKSRKSEEEIHDDWFLRRRK